MLLANGVALPPLERTLIRVKLESNKMRPVALHSIGSQQPSALLAEYTVRIDPPPETGAVTIR